MALKTRTSDSENRSTQMENVIPDGLSRISGYILKRPSANSKGLVCLRLDRPGEPYPREMIAALKRDWHFFWFSVWNTRHERIAYHDLIDIFDTWDEHAEDIRKSGRTDCIVLRGGSETYERHDELFYPIPDTKCDIDLLYVARFTPLKRTDMALACVHFVAQRKPDCRAVFLESLGSDLATRKWVREQIKSLGLENNLQLMSIPLQAVNSYMNRTRLSLFTSDEEGLCRATLQTLLAERPLLCHKHTRALTRNIFDDRYFYYYEEQTEESIGNAAWDILNRPTASNRGARDYLLKEKGFVFYDLPEWQEKIIAAAAPLYARDGQRLDRGDIVSASDATRFVLWRPFRLE